MEENKASFLQNNPLNEQETAAVQQDTQRLNEEMKIKEILAEQQKLQQLYNQVVVYIQQHPQMPTEEMIKYQTQLKQLSDYYQTNQEKLKTLGYSSVQVNKNVAIKKGARRNVSIKEIFIGCAVIILFFVLGLGILSFYLANNPESLGGFGALGISPATAKSILSLLSVTVMMVILLLGLVIVIVNTYRAFTIKNKPKGWYYSGIFFGMIILGIALGAGTSLISKVGAIDVESIANPEDVIKMNMVRYVVDESGNPTPDVHQIDGTFPLVAPINVSSSLLTANYGEFVKAVAPGVRVLNVQLDCGNKQILQLSSDEVNFASTCLYTAKGQYPISLILTYINGNGEETESSHLLKNLVISSEIKFKGINSQVQIGNSELVAGPLPVQIQFDADAVFQDFKLENYNIEWNGDNDVNIDALNETTYRHTYETAKRYYPMIRFPDVNALDEGGIWYSFPLRITKSSDPQCKVEVKQQQALNYIIEGSFLDGTEKSVVDYNYVIKDKLSNNKVIGEISEGGYVQQFSFPGQGSYTVEMQFVSEDGYEGSCSTELKIKEAAQYKVQYDFYEQKPTSNSFEKMDIDQIKQEKTIKITELPIKLKLKIQSIEPRTSETKVSVMFDDSPKIYTTIDEYIFDIRDSDPHSIQIKITDANRGLDYEENLVAKIGLDDVMGRLSLVGETSGYEPLTIQLDASSSRVNDSSDEITYFTYDFGDGQTQQKVSKGIVSHQYRFDYTNNNGIYNPKVTIYTKKGRSVTVNASDSVVVKKQVVKMDIYSTSHPLQEAKVGEPVKLALDFSGLPKKIVWDFGDGTQTTECEGRTCSEVTRSWQKSGSYLIKVYVEFEDDQSVEQTLQFKIR